MIRFLAFNYALGMQRGMILMDKFFFPTSFTNISTYTCTCTH